MGKFLKQLRYLRKIYHTLNFLGPYLILDTTLCLCFDQDYQRLTLHITQMNLDVTMKGEDYIK